jgi:hypothetical protein
VIRRTPNLAGLVFDRTGPKIQKIDGWESHASVRNIVGNGNGTVVVHPPAKTVEKRYLLAASTKASNFSNHRIHNPSVDPVRANKIRRSG